MRFAAPLAACRARTVRLLVPAAVLLAAFTPVGTSATRPATPAVTPAGREGVASYYRPEVRLRKLHLVRPDLIPYPLSYDVYC